MIRYNNVSVSITEENVRKFRTSVAILLLISMVLSACSKEKVEETEPSESTSAVAEVGTYDYLVDEVIPVDDLEEAALAYDYTGMNFEDDCYIPENAYNFVIDSILDYFDARAAGDNSGDYVGMVEPSGIEKFISDGGTKDDLAVAFVDVNGDRVAELIIVSLAEDYGYPILEMYSYEERYGVHPIVHGNDNLKYYLLEYNMLFCDSTEVGSQYVIEYYFDDNCDLVLSFSYYIYSIDGVDHLCQTWAESGILSNPADSDNAFDFGSMNDGWNAESYREEQDYWIANQYEYRNLIPLSDYMI